jgi:DNA-binding NarL/FixJ family response regulator
MPAPEKKEGSWMIPIRILIADDHAAVRRVIARLLAHSPEYLICGEAVSGQDAIQKAKELHPDVMLLDVSLPDMSGLEALRAIRRDAPATRVLIVSQHDPEYLKASALALGAHGCVNKAELVAELAPAISALSLSSGLDTA